MTDQEYEHEKCSRCGDEITDTSQSDQSLDDLCADCRFEENAS